MREDVNEQEKVKKNVDDFAILTLEGTQKLSYVNSNFRTSFRKFDTDKEIPALNKIINYFRNK